MNFLQYRSEGTKKNKCYKEYLKQLLRQKFVISIGKNDHNFLTFNYCLNTDCYLLLSCFCLYFRSVTSAVFTREDKVVSGSDDRSVKVC